MTVTMEKKPYIEPALRTIPLGILESFLASVTGTGSDLKLTGDYKDDDFDDLFN